MSERGVLLMAYGSPETAADVAPYFADIRGGRTPSPEAVAELTARYARVGGRTPLLRLTRELAAEVQARLGPDVRVWIGMRHWHPYIREAVAEIGGAGVRDLVAMALAPHYAALSVGAYREAAEAALAALPHPPRTTYIMRWHDHAGFRRLIAERIRLALAEFPPEAGGRVRLVFSAHSLPRRILDAGDPYPEELRESAAAIAALVGSGDWELCYQSAGGTREPWLGPDLVEVVGRLASEGRRYILSIPFGFVCEHLEVLYDVDVEAREAAAAHGVLLRRIAMPNADPAFADVVADVLRGRLAQAGADGGGGA